MKHANLVWVATAVSLMFGCGGGGGGNDDQLPTGVEPPLAILPTYNFEVGEMLENIGFFVDIGGQLDITIEFGNTLFGSVDLNVISPSNVTFLSYVTDVGSNIRVTIRDSQSTLNGTYVLNVTSAVNASVGDSPTSGAFDVVAPNETVSVSFTGTGVELSLDGAAATPFTWEEYQELLDNPLAETWQRRASLAGATFGFVFDLMFEIADQLDELELTLTTNPTVETCDMFTSSPPSGVLAQGESVFTRLSSGPELNPGDAFDWRFTNCWDSSSYDLIDGAAQFSNYIEEVDANNTLTRIGFAPVGNTYGGIDFFALTISETEENQGVFTIDPAAVITVRGGFWMLLSQP